MNFVKYLLWVAFVCSTGSRAQNPVLIGYWQNWDDAGSPYIPLDQVDPAYDILCVAFAVPTSDFDMTMNFTPEGVNQATFISKIQSLQADGKKVLLSIGGADTAISLTTEEMRNNFIDSVGQILNTYGFDGIDIAIGHGDSILAAGTINSPTNFDCINFMYALSQVRSHYFDHFNKNMMLTFALKTVYVQGGMSAFGGVWGGYLSIIDYFRNELDYIHLQLYDSDDMPGIDGNFYTQGTADFIVAMTEAIVLGFDTDGGHFDGFPESKVVVGLPTCPAAADGFVSTDVVGPAINYLRGNGSPPGNYTLLESSGYPNLGGMMGWSVNWDNADCNIAPYEYASNFGNLFASLSIVETSENKFIVAPNPVEDCIYYGESEHWDYDIVNMFGQSVQNGKVENGIIVLDELPSGLYVLKMGSNAARFLKK